MKKLLVILSAFTALLLTACSGSDKLKIGVMLPLTGPVASYGQGAKKGIEMSLADSGIADKVQLVFQDSLCTGKDSVNVINNLIGIHQVKAVIGELCSTATLAAVSHAADQSIPMISPASTAPSLDEAGPYFYRTIPNDSLQGQFGAEAAYERGSRKLAILYINEDYGIGFTEVLEPAFEKLGGKVVAKEKFDRDIQDLRAQLSKIKASGADSLFLISNNPQSSIAALRQSSELGLDLDIYGSEGVKAPEVAEASGAEGLLVCSVSEGSETFIAKHESLYGSTPGPFAAQAYDAFTALAKAIEKAEADLPEGSELNGEAIKKALDEVSFTGVSGEIVFDDIGNIAGGFNLYEVRDGEFKAL